MLQPCQDNYSTTFDSYERMRRYHEKESAESLWRRCKVNELHIEPLDKLSPLYETPSAFAAGVSRASIEDTAENLGLALQVEGAYYPVRSTAYKSLLDRAKINGTALPKLSRQKLASVLNDCLALYSAETLLLIRDEKISATHSGDSMDYSVLPIDELLKVLTRKLDDRFAGNVFQGGYCDHALAVASWSMPGQKEDLLGAYAKLLESKKKTALAAKLVPSIRFVTSDTGVASAKVSAMLEGTQHPIHIRNVNSRLRKTLDYIGLGRLIQVEHKMLSLNPAYVITTDVDGFDELNRKILQVRNAADPDMAVLRRLYEQVLALYQGSLLPRQDHYHWVMAKAVAYQNQYLGILNDYLELLYKERQFVKVQKIASDSLSIDVYASAMHFHLIRALLATGSKSLAKVYFRQSAKFLTDEHRRDLNRLFMNAGV